MTTKCGFILCCSCVVRTDKYTNTGIVFYFLNGVLTGKLGQSDCAAQMFITNARDSSSCIAIMRDI